MELIQDYWIKKYREGGDNSGRRYSGSAQRSGESFFTVRTQDRKCVDTSGDIMFNRRIIVLGVATLGNDSSLARKLPERRERHAMRRHIVLYIQLLAFSFFFVKSLVILRLTAMESNILLVAHLPCSNSGEVIEIILAKIHRFCQ